MGEFILKVLEILLITYFNVLSNLFNDFLVKLKVLHRMFNISEFFMNLLTEELSRISNNSYRRQCLNFPKGLLSLFIKLDSWHQNIFNSVHQSDRARSFLLWCEAPTVTTLSPQSSPDNEWLKHWRSNTAIKRKAESCFLSQHSFG